MSDKTPDDDFDLDDFDDELADESWDEFDDEAIEAETSDDDEGATPSAPAQKTFVQKNFNLIVIGVLIIGASIVALTQFMGPSVPVEPSSANSTLPASDDESIEQFDISEPVATDATNEIAELTEDSGLPPMPAPMNSAEEDSFDITELGEDEEDIISNEIDLAAPQESIPDFDLSEDDALTPLPGDDVLENTDLAELTIDEVPAVAVSDGALSAAESADISILGEDVTEESEPAIEIPEAAEEDISQPYNNADDVSISDMLPSGETDEITALETVLPEEDQSPEIAAENIVPDAEPDAEQADAAAENNEALIELEEKLISVNNDLSEKIGEISQKEEKITSLEDEIIALEAKIKKLEAEKTTEKAPAPAKETTKTEPAKAAPKPPQKSASPSKTTKKVSKNWIMRSAQPGKALVSEGVSGDMRSVEVGDNLSGIGRITSINIEGSKWVIRGTQGTITQ